MQELDHLIEKLNTDQYSAVSVFDLDTNSFVFRNKTHVEITADEGTAEQFFETLFANGHKRLSLSLKRKNGSTFKIDGQSFEVNFSKDNSEPMPAPQAPNVPQQPTDFFQNSYGLGTLDMINLFVAKGDAQRLLTENEVLKAENKEFKKQNEELKEERLASKYDINKSKGNQEMLLGAIQQLPALMSFVKGTPPVGLGNAVESYTSPAKKHFATALQSIDDSVVNVLDSINNGLNSNVEFSNELAELLKKHHLWEA